MDKGSISRLQFFPCSSDIGILTRHPGESADIASLRDACCACLELRVESDFLSYYLIYHASYEPNVTPLLQLFLSL